VTSRAFAIAALLASGASSAFAQAATEGSAASAPRAWALRVPTVEKVVFRGSVNHDATGLAMGPMMYPAPGPVGFLAAIVTHGLLNEGMRQSQKNQIQASADEVLQPLAPVLGGFTHQRLFEAGRQRSQVAQRARLLAVTEPPGADWLVESAPMFSMTQDRRALVLDNAMRIFAPGSTTVSHAQTVRVVSAPLPAPAPAAEGADAAQPADDPSVAVWLDEQGRRLTDESATLLAESLDIALGEAVAPASDDKTPQRTFRYAEGGGERMERAQLVSERCGRRVIRTLRGWLMSIPVPDGSGEACAAAATSNPSPKSLSSPS